MLGHLHMMMEVLICPRQQSHCRRLLLSHTAVDPTIYLWPGLKLWILSHGTIFVQTSSSFGGQSYPLHLQLTLTSLVVADKQLRVFAPLHDVVFYFRWHLEHAVVLHKHSHVDCRVNYLSSPGFREHIYTPIYSFCRGFISWLCYGELCSANRRHMQL